MKILTAIGARPQFIKAAPVSDELARRGIEEVLVHSGQHYDHRMSQVFFDELGLNEPDINLGVGSGSHAKQTADMLVGFEAAIREHKPDWVIVHGDTNSTLAAALAAVKLHVRVAHNEAGLRSFNRSMPEEHNRILTDHCADLLLCPTTTALDQLSSEGLGERARLVGDVMLDAWMKFGALADAKSRVLQKYGLKTGSYVLATLHRPYNVDVSERLEGIFRAFSRSNDTFVLPCHPRLAANIEKFELSIPKEVRLIDPVGYLDMLALERNARMIATDSGGVQKEAFFASVPSLTIRPETEWVETVEIGWNKIVDADEDLILEGLSTRWWASEHPTVFGSGDASNKLVESLTTSGRG